MQLLPLTEKDKLTPRQLISYYGKIERDGRVTNMQQTLLHAPEAFDAYMEWYKLRDLLTPIFGQRAIWIFCHVISDGTDCLVCSTFFRRLLIDAGISPEEFVPTEEEALLQSLAKTFVNAGHGVDAETWKALAAKHDARTLSLLIAFGGMMVANNLFNNILDVPLDDYLYDYRKA